ncbi:MAG: DctP family TRAP transporter solute-binding subunit [Rhodobacteraceae bacterium]|nr:DctP family TRAP transporter solute-binding subunit [Paracoccaceae bacterium]
MSFARSLFSIVCLFVVAAGQAAADEPILIRFAHVVGENTPKGVGATLFKQRAEERLAGRVKVEIYPRSEKFDDDEVFVAMLFGDLEMAAPSFVQLQGFVRAFQVFDLPFLFKDVEQVHRFQTSTVGQQLMQMLLPYGLEGLAYWDNGMRVISADRTVRVPADVRGLNFRLEPSKVFQEQYRRIGVVGIPMPFSRVTDAIREGLVDGQENAWSNIYSRGIHKLNRDYLELDHSFLGYLVVTNADFWQGLPDDIRAALNEILREVTEQVNQLALEKAVGDRAKAIAEGGIQVVSPSRRRPRAMASGAVAGLGQFEDDIGKEVIEAAIAAGNVQ